MSRCLHICRLLCWAVLLAGASGAGWCEAAAPAVAETPRPLLTNYNSFWNLDEAARQREHDVRFEAEVLFYDPVWRVMWLENEGMPLYCNTGSAVFPVRKGQRVRLECRVLPTRGFVPMDLRLTPLGEAPPRQPPVLTGHPEQFEHHHEGLVTVAAFVDRQQEIDPRHLRLFLIVEGVLATTNVLIDEGAALPDYTGAVVEATGLIFLHKNADGVVESLDFWVDGLGSVRLVAPLARDPRFEQPARVGPALRALPSGTPVRVQGEVRAATPGVSLVLWDESNQITVRSAQTGVLQPGAAVEAIGILQVQGPELVVRSGLWRQRLTTPSPEAALRLKLRRASQVLELGPDEARCGHRVDLWGVVTWSHPDVPFFYLQDSTRGVCIRMPGAEGTPPPSLGATVRVTGATTAGPFAPVVEIEQYAVEGTIRLPEPRLSTLDQALSGAEEGKRIELRGYLQAIHADGPWTELHLTSPTGEFTARLIADQPVADLRGAVVLLRGVCTATADERGELTGIVLLVATRSDITVEEPAILDPFAAALTPLSSLRRFSPLQIPYRRVRLLGNATHVSAGRRLVVQDGDHGLEVLARDTGAVQPGQDVEVVGFPGRQGNRMVLREAQVRRAPNGPAIAPRLLPDTPGVNRALDNLLVEVACEIIEVIGTGTELHLLVKSAGARFFARLEGASREAARFAVGSQVRCTGVYQVEYDAYGQPADFYLRLRTPADVVVVARPPWLTRGRALTALAALGLGVAMTLLWVGALRRRVRVQTEQIRAQLEHQAELEHELQKAAKLESLGLLAGGIAHDFNNLLTVVMGNITLAMLEDKAMEVAGDCLRDAERGAQRAKDLTHQLLTFAKGGEPLRAAEVLPEIVREASEFVLRGTAVKGEFAFDHGLWPVEVDRGQIGQVVHNLVLNALQAMPEGGLVRVGASNVTLSADEIGSLAAGRYVRLKLADTGPGMPSAVLARIFDPYFTTKKGGSGLGLATVHSIVRRHRGHIAVYSEIGHGTVFRIWLPAAEGAAAAPASTVVALPHRLSGRVLVMDDEEDIRRLVTALLRRLGLEPLAVADGAAAVEAYAAARAAGQPFDLVITDLTVPGGMGGREAMELLRRLDPKVKAIVSSGYSNDPVMANYRDHGFSGMVEKPYEVEALVACIGRVLGETAGDRRQSD